MVLTKLKNKLTGYHCDKCNIVPKVIFSDENGFLCEDHAVKKYGLDAVKSAVVDEE